MLSRNGYKAILSELHQDVLAILSENSRDYVVLTDTSRPAVKILEKIKDKKYPCRVIVMGSHIGEVSVQRFIDAGAFEYLAKPVEDEHILSSVSRAFKAVPVRTKDSQAFKVNAQGGEQTYYGLVGKGQKMNSIYSIVERVANTKATILIHGESGTGKRLIAHAIHKADTSRCDKPFIEVSCGALPKEIIESELFGHTKGSFTGALADRKGRFEIAHGGTMLLDDIDSFSLDLQVKLLRVLQHKEFERVGDHNTMKVDVRIVATTNRDLEREVAEGRFRQDLYYRLNVISICMPPLRERREDLPLLIEHAVKMFSGENRKHIECISSQAAQILTAYDWPGNVRQLENIIERAVILDTDGIIAKDDLPDILVNRKKLVLETAGEENQSTSLKGALKDPEKIYILKILQGVGWNKKKAAVKLGVNRTTLYNKMRKYNLTDAERQTAAV